MQEQIRQINRAGIELIKSFESLRLRAYQDSVGVWTIGYGHTKGVHAGQEITEAQAEEFLRVDLDEFCAGVEKFVHVALNDNQFAALVSLSFNIGLGNFSRSSLLHRLNAGDYAGAARQFALWNKAGGRVLAGLTRRRAAEARLFLMQVAAPSPFVVNLGHGSAASAVANSPADASQGTPGGSQSLSTVERSTEATPAPAAPAIAPAPDASGDASALFDEIPVTDTAKQAAGSILKRLGAKLGVLVVSLWSLGFLGRLVVIFAGVALLCLLYSERRLILSAARRLMAKLKG